MAAVNEIVDRCPTLPALPSVVARVGAMLADGAYDVDELTRLVSSDEALSAAALRAGNSAAYGAPGAVFDLRASIVRLGGSRLARIVLDQKASSLFGDVGAVYGLRREDMWRGALGGAIAAELLARRHGGVDPGVAYVAGLLRDIGKLVVEVAVGRAPMEEAIHAPSPDEPFDRSEHRVFGADHAEIGAELAQRWGLPERIVGAIRFHHDPPAPGDPRHDRLYDIVHAADTVTLWAGLAVGDDGLRYRLAPHVRDELRLSIHEVEDEIALTWAEVDQIERILHGTDADGASS